MSQRLRRSLAGRSESGVWAAAAAVALVLLAVGLVGLHVRDYTRLSPVDELQHLDYMNRVVRDGEFVRRGDLFQAEALRTEACQGLDAAFQPPPCGLAEYDPRAFQEGGVNTAFIHPPVYYAISGYVAAALSEVVGSDSLFTTGRLTGALWMVGALLLMWMAMAELAIGWTVRVPILLLTMTAPAVLLQSATINPDVTALFAGSAILLTVLRWERTKRWWWPAAAAAFAVALKSTNVIAVAFGVAYVLIRYLQERRTADGPVHGAATPTGDEGGRRRVVLVIGAMFAGVAVVSLVWLLVGSAAARVDTDQIPMLQRFHVASIGWAEVLENLTTGVTPLDAPYVPDSLRTAWIAPIATVVDRLFLVGLVAAMVVSRPGDRLKAVALATGAALAAVGPGFVLVNYLLTETYVPIPHRYGLSAVPGLVVALASLLEDRRLGMVVLAFAGAVTLGTLRAVAG